MPFKLGFPFRDVRRSILTDKAKVNRPSATIPFRSLTERFPSGKPAAMPVPTRVQPEKNIWVAAGDGDLARVQVSRHTLPLSFLSFFL